MREDRDIGGMIAAPILFILGIAAMFWAHAMDAAVAIGSMA